MKTTNQIAKELKVNGSLKASSILAATTIYAFVCAETEKAIQIEMSKENGLAAFSAWVPKSVSSVDADGTVTVAAWFFEKNIQPKAYNF